MKSKGIYTYFYDFFFFCLQLQRMLPPPILPHFPSQEEPTPPLLTELTSSTVCSWLQESWSWGLSLWFNNSVHLYVPRPRDPLAPLRVPNTDLVGVAYILTFPSLWCRQGILSQIHEVWQFNRLSHWFCHEVPDNRRGKTL